MDIKYTTDSIVNSVIDELINRSAVGEKKYGTNLDRTDLSVKDYLQHAKEEALDFSLYITKVLTVLKENKD